MVLERTRVSRKTPGDGKLEITRETAAHLAALGAAPPLRVGDTRATAAVTSLACTCRRAGAPHVHHFLESALLTKLAVDSVVEIRVADGAVEVRPAEASAPPHPER